MAGRSSASAMLRSRNGMSSQSMHRARDVLRIVLATYGFRALMLFKQSQSTPTILLFRFVY